MRKLINSTLVYLTEICIGKEPCSKLRHVKGGWKPCSIELFLDEALKNPKIMEEPSGINSDRHDDTEMGGNLCM
jgi:hypothetical protein